MREILSNVRNYLLDRLNDLFDLLDAFRYRAESRFRRADLRIAYALALGALLGSGVLAATMMASSDAETTYVAQPNAARGSYSSGSEVVTETVKRQGRTVRLVSTTRLVRERPGTTVLFRARRRGPGILPALEASAAALGGCVPRTATRPSATNRASSSRATTSPGRG